MDEEFANTLISELRSELRHGFGELRQGFGELRQGLDTLSEKVDQTNLRLDQTIIRLDRTQISVELLRAEMNTKFDGVGVYLKSINGHILEHCGEISDIKSRLKKLENQSDQLGS